VVFVQSCSLLLIEQLKFVDDSLFSRGVGRGRISDAGHFLEKNKLMLVIVVRKCPKLVGGSEKGDQLFSREVFQAFVGAVEIHLKCIVIMIQGEWSRKKH
jgi:hypothetical protein